MNDILETAIRTLGEDNQLNALIEELAELLHALTQMKKSKAWIENHEIDDHTLEEMVDVHILIEQFRLQYELIFHSIYLRKVGRLERLIHGKIND